MAQAKPKLVEFVTPAAGAGATQVKGCLKSDDDVETDCRRGEICVLANIRDDENGLLPDQAKAEVFHGTEPDLTKPEFAAPPANAHAANGIGDFGGFTCRWDTGGSLVDRVKAKQPPKVHTDNWLVVWASYDGGNTWDDRECIQVNGQCSDTTECE